MDWNSEDERKESRAAKGGKQVMALSKAQYRGVAIYETPLGFGVFLGVWYFTLATLQAATEMVDEWFAAKRN